MKLATENNYDVTLEITETHKIVVRNKAEERTANVSLNFSNEDDAAAPADTWKESRYLIYCDPLPNNTYVACLGIEDINASDAGKYKISAKNKLGEIEFVPSFIWTLDGKPITMGARYKQEILSEGNIHTIFLEIAQLTAKDSDAYKVTTNIQLNIEAIDFKLPEGITPSFLN
ncbi:unnamed protein product [Adineta steineri]|uniref:Uncharacterized protein n=1 Tax=Adineta steineri TaxID=433720 RepID=A0A819PNG8_9BILA|nr:unnamed protein product [Adineta steineri]